MKSRITKTLRNCLVHARGQILNVKKSSDQKKLRAFVARKKTLSLSENEYFSEITIEEGFCEEVLETIKKFLREWLYPRTNLESQIENQK